MLLYRAYFVPRGMDPMGIQIVVHDDPPIGSTVTIGDRMIEDDIIRLVIFGEARTLNVSPERGTSPER